MFFPLCLICLGLLSAWDPVLAQTLAERERNCAIQTRSVEAGRNTHVNACINYGWTLHLQGRDREAIRVLRQAARLDPANEKAYNALGVIYLFTSEYPKAVQANQAAIKLKPDNEVAYYNLGLAQWELGEFSRAVVSEEQATRLDPSNPHPWVALAIARAQAGSGDASAAYRQAIRLDSRYLQSAYLNGLRASDFSKRQIKAAQQLLGQLRRVSADR